MTSIKHIKQLFLFALLVGNITLAQQTAAENYAPEAIRELMDSIIREPSAPVTMGFDPQMLKSMPAADPNSKVELIRPPQVNNRGTAEVSYTLEVPPARNGMQPQLSIHYSSDADTGLLARGWDLYIPTIATDAGNPSSYLMDGEKMEAGQAGRFYLRRETGFKRIMNAGDSWEITGKDGTKYTYGLDKDGNRDGFLTANGISQWKLTRAEEVHGDYIEYKYRTFSNALYLDSIKVGNKDEDPHTRMKFRYTGSQFLSKITIEFEDKKDPQRRYKPLRSYSFSYEEDSLKSITHNYYDGNSEKAFATHTFEYYNDSVTVAKLAAYIERTGNTELDSLLIDRTSKLKMVRNPLGGCFTIDYNYAPVADTLGKTRDTTRIKGKLVMKSVRINDGIPGDGAHTKNVFAYSGGMYDGREKTFLGYEKVKIKQINTTDSTVYRHILRTYNTASYYTRGNLLSSVITGADELDIYREERYGYYSYQMNSSYNFTLTGTRPVFFTPLRSVKVILYEDGGNMVASEKNYTYYLNHGGLENYTCNSGPGTPGYTLHVDYRVNNIDYIISPTNIEVTGSDGKMYRKTTADYDGSGQITQLTRTLESGKTATTGIEYDESGNIVKKTLPENKKGQKMTYKYLYDRDYNTYVERVEDSFGYRTEMEDYDYRYGIPRTLRDMNRYILKKTIDNLGRIDTILSPNEQESGKKYTAIFNYTLPARVAMKDSIKEYFNRIDTLFLDVEEYIYMNEFPSDSVITRIMEESGRKKPGKKICFNPWIYDSTHIPVAYDTIRLENCFCDDRITKPVYAVTGRYDYARQADNLETVLFVDGTGRVIQEKRDAEITTSNDGGDPQRNQNSMIVSGRNNYDPFGRVIAKYYSTTDPLSAKTTLKQGVDGMSPTMMSYDLLDRVTEVTLPDGNVIRTAYSIDSETSSVVSTVTDANQNVRSYYTGGSGLVTREQQGTLTTVFNYDPIGQLVETVRGQENVQYEYDLAGKQIKITSSKGGTTTLTYDKAGNLVEKQTANLQKESKKIEYSYDYNRLTDINYPQYPENSVTYTYGGKNASHNRVGRIMLQEDASGAQEFFYGRLGEVSKVRRTIIIPNQAIATYVTQWQYDSWNRLTEIIYPDGEKVIYAYNLGGLPESMKGGKSYCYDYVSLLGYDKFEQRVYMKYKNETVMTYGYDPARRWLNKSSVWLNGKLLQGDYSFDATGNLTSATHTNGLGELKHASFEYDGIYNLTKANGAHNSSTLSYDVSFLYDGNQNRTEKKRELEQEDFLFQGRLAIDETVGQYNGAYDHNGNLTCIEPYNGEGTLPTVVGEHKFIWDEENRLLAVKDNSYISHYLYDAQGNRVVKTGHENESVYLNALFSGGSTVTSGFTAYVNPYMEVSPGGQYTKHFFIGNERVVSKLSQGADSYTRRIEYAGHEVEGVKINYREKYDSSLVSIKNHYGSFGMEYYGKDNDDYVNGKDFCCDENESDQHNGTPNDTLRGNVDTEKEKEELLQYYYHSDYQGSTLLLTNKAGAAIQYLDYLPFGEPFVDKREGDWYTRYLFHGKEYDEETGFYYYSGRYYYPAFGIWLNASSPFDRSSATAPYIFKNNNPKKK